MKKHLLTAASTAILGVAFSSSAMANLSVFHKDVGGSTYCGYKDSAGKVVVAANKYEACGALSDGLAYVGLQANYKHLQGFIDQTGKLVIPVKYEAADGSRGGQYKSFSEGLVAVYKNGEYGYMNKDQKLVIPYKYEQAANFTDGMAVVSNNGLYGAINKAGKLVVPTKHDSIGSYSDGVAPYTTGGSPKYGYINKAGVVVLKPKWNIAEGFSEGLAAVAVAIETGGDYKWGVIDKSGNFVVKPKYDNIIAYGEDDDIAYDAGYYKNGKIFMYDYVNPKKAYESKVTRYTLDKTGKVLASKTFSNWAAVVAEYKK